MMMNKNTDVWVVYASEQQQYLCRVTFAQGMTVEQAIEQSGICQQVTLAEDYACGIFGQKVKSRQQELQAGDRVEIYRPLKINPKETRRNRAEKNPTSRYLVKQRARGVRFRHSEEG